MKILYVVHEGKLGGATKSVIALTQLMIKKGHEVHVLLPHKQSEAKSEFEKNSIHVFSKFFLWWQYPKNESLVTQLMFKIGYRFNSVFFHFIKKELKNECFDLVHTNSSVIDIGAKIAKYKKCKHVWHFREFGEDDLNTRYIKGKAKSMDFARSNTDKFIFISNDIRKAYSNYVPEEQSVVIYNGISSNFIFEKQNLMYCKDNVVNFLISGALQEGKGQKLAILAANELRKKGYKDFRINIAGRAITNYAKEIKNLVDQLNLSEYINFLDFCNNLQEIRQQMDVEIVCSNREAFGRVTIEAMMCSNPVIGSNSGANPELIQHMKNGLLFANNDFEDLSKQMKYLIDNREMIAEMGHNALLFSSQRFTAEKNADEINNLYELVINEKRVK